MNVNMLEMNWEFFAERVTSVFGLAGLRVGPSWKVWGVPRGGIHVAQEMAHRLGCEIVEDPEHATIIVDDIVDSGATRDRYREEFPSTQFVGVIDKTLDPTWADIWVVFPWELHDQMDDRPEEHYRRFIQSMGGLGLSPDNLLETPRRVVKAFQELTQGIDQSPSDILSKRFGVDGLDEMVIVQDIPFSSLCEHHLLPFTGTATVAYIAKDFAVGLSKIPRLVACYSQRLQMQERLAQQIAGALMGELETAGAACLIRASHSCMGMRGIRSGGQMIASSLLGVFRDDPTARAEFLALARPGNQ